MSSLGPVPGRGGLPGAGVTPGRVTAVAVAVLAALVLQGSVLSRLPLPGGVPNLVLVLVLAVALVGGSTAGMATGFAAGVLADLLSAHPVGLLALCLAVAGFLAGSLRTDTTRGVLWPLLVVAVGAAATLLLYVGVLALLGRPDGSGLRDLPTALLYDVLLTPFVVPMVSAVGRRLDGTRR